MRTFLKKITSLTPIAAGAAAGMIVLGIVSIVGGSYDHEVVHNQLGPQKIYFPKPAEYPNLKSYEGQGTALSLTEGERKSLQLKAIPAPEDESQR